MVGLQSSYLNYQVVVRDLDKALSRKAAEPVVAREIARFTEGASGIQSVNDLFDDIGIYNFAVRAYGMEELVGSYALLRKVIGGGTGEGGYAARLSDSRYLDLASAFLVVGEGVAPSALYVSGDGVAQRYRDGIKGAGDRALARLDEDIAAYEQAVNGSGFYSFSDLVANDTALIFSLKAYGLERLVGQIDEVRETLKGAGAKIDFQDATESWNFDQFRLKFGVSGGKVNYQDTVIAKYREAAYSVGTQLTESVDEHVSDFLTGLSGIATVDDLLKNWEVLSVGLRAYDLDRFILSDKDALAAALKGDTRAIDFRSDEERENFLAFKSAFAFDAKGNTVMASLVRDIDEAVKGYVRHTLEIDLGKEDTNVRLALNFQRRAGEITSAYDILADEGLATVVRTAFGIPSETATADIDAQARMILSRINIEDFQDPEKVEKLIARFLLMADVEEGAANAPILTLFNGGTGLADLSYDLLYAYHSGKS